MEVRKNVEAGPGKACVFFNEMYRNTEKGSLNWLAHLEGLDPKYIFKRNFKHIVNLDKLNCGVAFIPVDAVYEYCFGKRDSQFPKKADPRHCKRGFFVLTANGLNQITREEAVAILLPKAERPKSDVTTTSKFDLGG